MSDEWDTEEFIGWPKVLAGFMGLYLLYAAIRVTRVADALDKSSDKLARYAGFDWEEIQRRRKWNEAIAKGPQVG